MKMIHEEKFEKTKSGFSLSTTVTLGLPFLKCSRWKKEIFESNFCRNFHDTNWKTSNTVKRKPSFAGCEIGSLLGSGGFGSVFEANLHGRRVAVKRIHRYAKNPRALKESIEAEKLILPFRHVNIVQTLAVIEGESLLDVFVVMEFAGCNNLQTVIDDERELLDCARRLNFAHNIACALNYLHQNNILHLDLKPANVIVGSDGNCKLGDFGCCQRLEPLMENDELLPPSPTTSFSVTGTFAYRAPELLKGELPTVKADMYSLGILLWQMLTREQPYGLENQFVVIFGVVAYHMRPTLSDDMNVACTQCGNQTTYIALMRSLWDAEQTRRPSTAEVLQILNDIRDT